MRRVIVIAAVGLGLGLAGCSSFSLDAFKSAPATMQVQLVSNPPGADARTSLGPGCKTPCTVQVPAPEGDSFSVNYTLARYLPVDVPVQVIKDSGGLTGPATAVTNPNPVVGELQPMPPPPKPVHKRMRPKKPKAPQSAAAPAAPGDSAFPDPGAAQPAAPPPPPASPSR